MALMTVEEQATALGGIQGMTLSDSDPGEEATHTDNVGIKLIFQVTYLQ